jgi:hypothetical protein
MCEVCGNVESGWDMGISEAGMYECNNGHTFCESHIDSFDSKSKKEICIELIKNKIETYTENMNNSNDIFGDEKKWGSKKYYEEIINLESNELKEIENCDDDFDYDECLDKYEFRYACPESMCPICNLNHITESDMISYLFKKFDLNHKDIATSIKSTFKTYNDFKNYNKE